MAKSKPKKAKMNTAEAVKVLANEVKIIQTRLYDMFNSLQQLDLLVKDYIALFEQYIQHTKDGQEFVDKMQALVEETVNAQKKDEQANEENTDGDSEDERVGAEGVRAQEG